MELTQEALIRYAEQQGIKGRRILSVLGKNRQFINAMQSAVGAEFLRWLIARAESNRIALDTVDIDSSKEKFAELRGRFNESQELLFGFLDVFDNHEKLLQQVKEEIVKV